MFTEACQAAYEASKPKVHRTSVQRDCYGAHARLVMAYFSEHPQYDESTFCERFRMSRRLFTKIIREVTDDSRFFQQRDDCAGHRGISALMRCTSAIRQLAYGCVHDYFDEYLQMGATTARKCLKIFCKGSPLKDFFSSATFLLREEDKPAIMDSFRSILAHLVLAFYMLIREADYRQRRSMEIGLSTKRKLGFVKGTIPRPPHMPVTPENTVAKSVMFIGTASEIWSQLETRFSLSNRSRKYKLCKDMFGISQQGSSKEEQRLFQFLNDLDDWYSAQRSPLLLINPLPSVENACANVGKEKCSICGFKWHPPEKWWEKVGYPVWNHKNVLKDMKPGATSGDYTGATIQMIHFCKDMINAKILEILPKITLPNGDSFGITQIGQVRLKNGILLKDVLCVPTFKFSLLSVSKLTKDKNNVTIIFPIFCVIQDLRTRKVQGLGRKIRGMYYLFNVPIDKVDAKLRIEVENNDYSRATWTYLMVHKSDALEVIKAFLKFVELQFNTKVTCMRSDNALEFVKGHCALYSADQGIEHQTTFVDKQQQNGYPAYQKRYKLYNLLTHNLFVSRDVIFHEHISPFAESSSQSFFQPLIVPMLTHPAVYENCKPMTVQNDQVLQEETVVPNTPEVSTSTLPTITNTEAQVRKSTRFSKPPSCTKDFVVPSLKPTVNQATALVLSYQFYCFLSTLVTQQDPKGFKKVVKDHGWC
ncbi:cysteine-rich receptor-like protein kinase 8 [Tanacetum coccineum]